MSSSGAAAYRKVRKDGEKAPDNEVRITKRKPLRNYVTYVLSQFRERGATEVTLRSMGETMDKIVSVAEIVKYRVKGLYQINNIGSQTFEDVFEPLYEGLDTLVFKRTVQFFTITLTKIAPQDKTYGFQEPIPEDQVDERAEAPRGQGGETRRREGGRGGRGGRRGGPRVEGGERPPREGGDRPPREGGDRRPRTEGGERRPRTEGGDRPPREGGDRPPREFGDRPPRDFGDRPPRDFGDRRRGGTRGGYRGPRGGAELVADSEGRVDVRPPRTEGETGIFRGSRGGYRGGDRREGGFRGGRGGFRGGERRDEGFRGGRGGFRGGNPPRPFDGYNPQRGGDRRGGQGPRPSRGTAPQ